MGPVLIVTCIHYLFMFPMEEICLILNLMSSWLLFQKLYMQNCFLPLLIISGFRMMSLYLILIHFFTRIIILFCRWKWGPRTKNIYQRERESLPAKGEHHISSEGEYWFLSRPNRGHSSSFCNRLVDSPSIPLIHSSNSVSLADSNNSLVSNFIPIPEPVSKVQE